MKQWMQELFTCRVSVLIRKEFAQIRRNRRLAISLIIMPILQLSLFGYVLSPTVSNLRLGVVDDSKSPESRELMATLSESKSFRMAGYYLSPDQLGNAISRNDLDAGIVIPYGYSRNLQRGRPVTVQFLLNAMNANTATISRAYAKGVIQAYNQGLARGGLHATFQEIAAPDINHRGQVSFQHAFLYNPGLVSSWFIVTGIFGLLVILNGSIISAAAMVRERAVGTLEQLLMSPASTTEIIIAKIASLFSVQCLMVLCAIAVMKLVFQVPSHGSLLLLICGAALCILSGISIGTVIATFTNSSQQAQLTSFFVNPPLASLSGALMPIEAMPHWMQPLTRLNPIFHFGVIARGTLIKGSGIGTLWPHLLALFVFTFLLVSLSVWRLRKQLK
jgi:ABC-2 type transport system permease protein